jgi:hydrogenase maturation protease
MRNISANTLILGLGNILMGDEGIGVRSIEYMQDHEWPEGIRLLDGGTGGFHLLSLFKEYEKFIIIDATVNSGEQGEVHVLKPRFASDFPKTLTSHDIGLRDLMQSAELLGDLPEIFLVTINIKDCNSVGIGVTEELEAVLPEVYEKVREVMGV